MWENLGMFDIFSWNFFPPLAESIPDDRVLSNLRVKKKVTMSIMEC